MRILFVVPPYRTTDALVSQLYPMPLGAVSMGTVLQQAGHKVEIKDFLLPSQKSKCPNPSSFAGFGAPAYRHYGTPMEECKTWLRENVTRFDVVGLCMGQCNIYETGSMLGKYIKGLGLPLVIGGPFVTTATEAAVAMTGADIAVKGEGEWVCEEAFSQAINGWSGVIDGIRGEISTLPVPDWTLASPATYPKYSGKVRGVLTISRGCPFACRFCSVHTVMGKKHRRQDQARIRAELLALWKVRVRYFCFLDDNLFVSEKAVDQVLGAITDLTLSEPGFAKAKFYMEEGMEIRMAAKEGLIARIAGAGFENIALGLETMNRSSLEVVQKPYSTEEMVEAIAQCNAAGVVPKAFYIIGFPNDTVESVCRDLVEFGTLGLAARPNNLKMYPGTAMTTEYLEKGYIDSSYDWRMSSWHTPQSGALDYRQIKQLKTVLGAIGKAAEDFGIAVFADSLENIAQALAKKKLVLEYSAESRAFSITGKMFRSTQYRYLCALLVLRFGGRGYVIEEEGDTVRAVPLNDPANEIQQALVRALNPVDVLQSTLSLDKWIDPTWIVGDARNVEDLVTEEVDLIFTCPPYFDLEVYSDDGNDLSNCEDYDTFIADFRAIVAASVRRLKEDRFACVVVGDVRDERGHYRNFVSDTIGAFRDAGCELYNEAILVTALGSLPIRVGKQFTSARKLGKTHQNVLVFVKGDWRKATEACGPVEIADLDGPDEVAA